MENKEYKYLLIVTGPEVEEFIFEAHLGVFIDHISFAEVPAASGGRAILSITNSEGKNFWPVLLLTTDDDQALSMLEQKFEKWQKLGLIMGYRKVG